MLRENEAKLQEGTFLFGNDFYTTLYRKSKDRKRAREMSRDIARPVIKKPRQCVYQPFRQGPSGVQRMSRGETYREALAEAPLQRNKGTLNVNIPIVVEQMSKNIRNHYNLHPIIENLKPSKIVQIKSQWGGGGRGFF